MKTHKNKTRMSKLGSVAELAKVKQTTNAQLPTEACENANEHRLIMYL